MKTGPDGSTVLRVYEAAGQAVNGVRINWNVEVRSAHEANLMEDSLRQVAVQNNTSQFDLGPYEIKTFRVQLAARSER